MNILKTKKLSSGYEDVQILYQVSISMEEGEVICIIGPNGAGKSTLLKAIMGYLPVFGGRVFFKGKDCTSKRPDEMVKMGIGYTPQTEKIFPSLTVEENLDIGGLILENRDRAKQRIYRLFPKLKEMKNKKSRLLSGGERQMLALGRTLMLNPSLLLLDEPTAGLAPKVAKRVFDSIKMLNEKGISIVIVEQNAEISLKMSDKGYILKDGRNRLEAHSNEILRSKEIRDAYLGV